jgi:hypothetical protein
VPEGNKIQFAYTGVQEGKPYKELINLEFSDDSRTVVGRAETFVGGASTSVMELSLHK